MDALRNARHGAGMTQAGLADRLGRPQSYVAKCEGGERRLDVVEFCAWVRELEVAPMTVLQPVLEAMDGASD
ncbi:helix-turn-helix transcriptional regulator [Jannaschia sp. Os4]|uniref:helix-turn-helix domain-containing protein n=1 Tax=Jannaschia sp. Os4 TaxID=2807617 RepID=UPI0023AFDF5F|nr:helix-turn-helix transcriptional regulator [Jannaschia sp. Os4]